MGRIIASCLVLLVLDAALAGQGKYGVTVTKAKDIDFDKLETYSWSWGKPSHNKEINAWVVTAVGRSVAVVMPPPSRAPS